MRKLNQLLLKPTEVELGLQVGVEFDKMRIFFLIFHENETAAIATIATVATTVESEAILGLQGKCLR